VYSGKFVAVSIAPYGAESTNHAGFLTEYTTIRGVT
jgi:hypothetical protein